MKLVLVGVAAFVLALIAGTGIGVMTSPPPHPRIAAPDSTRAWRRSRCRRSRPRPAARS